MPTAILQLLLILTTLSSVVPESLMLEEFALEQLELSSIQFIVQKDCPLLKELGLSTDENPNMAFTTHSTKYDGVSLIKFAFAKPERYVLALNGNAFEIFEKHKDVLYADPRCNLLHHDAQIPVDAREKLKQFTQQFFLSAQQKHYNNTVLKNSGYKTTYR